MDLIGHKELPTKLTMNLVGSSLNADIFILHLNVHGPSGIDLLVMGTFKNILTISVDLSFNLIFDMFPLKKSVFLLLSSLENIPSNIVSSKNF